MEIKSVDGATHKLYVTNDKIEQSQSDIEHENELLLKKLHEQTLEYTLLQEHQIEQETSFQQEL